MKCLSKREISELTQQLLRIMNKYIAGEKKNLEYGEGNLLYRSEVHTIEAIGKLKTVNVTELANYLGVTKGAISQMVDKLIKKGMVNKTFISASVHEVALTLTELGVFIYKIHQERHQKLDLKIMDLLARSSNDNLNFLADFHDQIEALLDENLKDK